MEKGLEVVEYATVEWVDRFNNRRLIGCIGDVSPVEFEQAYCDSLEAPQPWRLDSTKKTPEKRWRFMNYVRKGRG